MRSKFMLCSLLAVGLLAASARADDKVTLKLRLEKGAEYKVVTKSVSETEFGQATNKETVETEALITVGEMNAEGDRIIKSVVTAMRLKTPIVEYDSKDPDGLAMGKAMFEEAAKPVTITIGVDGKTKSAKGGNIEGFPDIGAYPNHPVGVGDEWSSKRKFGENVKISMEMDMRYSLVEKKDGIVKIHASGTTVGEVVIVLEGVIEVDEKTGWVVSKKLEVTTGVKGKERKGGWPKTMSKIVMTCTKKK